MRYDEHDRVLVAPARKLVIRWTCKMDRTQAKFKTLSFWFMRLGAIMFAGSRRMRWEGVDIFHFNLDGEIIGKFTYANYPFPRLEDDSR